MRNNAPQQCAFQPAAAILEEGISRYHPRPAPPAAAAPAAACCLFFAASIRPSSSTCACGGRSCPPFFPAAAAPAPPVRFFSLPLRSASDACRQKWAQVRSEHVWIAHTHLAPAETMRNGRGTDTRASAVAATVVRRHPSGLNREENEQRSGAHRFARGVCFRVAEPLQRPAVDCVSPDV